MRSVKLEWLNTPDKIGYFHDENRWASNFYGARVQLYDEWYATVEHAYQASKTVIPALREPLQERRYLSAGEAKRMGRSFQVRPDWDRVKVKVMEVLLMQKFLYQNTLKKLLATDTKWLEEGNSWHDNFWGVCYCEECPHEGRNQLGLLLMKIRYQMRHHSIIFNQEEAIENEKGKVIV